MYEKDDELKAYVNDLARALAELDETELDELDWDEHVACTCDECLGALGIYRNDDDDIARYTGGA